MEEVREQRYVFPVYEAWWTWACWGVLYARRSAECGSPAPLSVMVQLTQVHALAMMQAVGHRGGQR